MATEMVPKEVEEAKPQTTLKMRMITDVLVEPSNGLAPTKRRRGKAKRRLTQIGNIRDFFPKLLTTKEWNPAMDMEVGPKVELRKRKALEMLEDHATRTTDAKSRRKMVEETQETKSTTNSLMLLGAKSISGRDPTDRLKRETTDWVDNEKDRSGEFPGDLDQETRTHKYSRN